MMIFKNRIEREKAIVQVMIEQYCHEKHKEAGSICSSCSELLAYSQNRLTRCSYGNTKPVCKACLVHCYPTARRGQMKQIMQWSGPRMIFHHPLYAFIHVVDSLAAHMKPLIKPNAEKFRS
jgi:hypothetical protein